MFIYLDIETTGTPSNEVLSYLGEKIAPAKNLKDPEKISADIARKEQEVWSGTALRGMWGSVACIGVAVDDGEPVVLSSDGDSEANLLDRFFKMIKHCADEQHGRLATYVGFNVLGFDLPFLWQRSVVLGVKPSVPLYQDSKPWSGRVVDLRYILGCGDLRAQGTLEDWCVATGCPVPRDDISGAEAPGLWKNGQYPIVMEHCRRDVVRCQWLHRKVGYK